MAESLPDKDDKRRKTCYNTSKRVSDAVQKGGLRLKLTWLGHSCFLLEQDGYRLVLDPYREVPGHPDVQAQAHEVLCSHGHFDHNAVEGVTLLPKRESPFTVRTVATWHDEQGGALRGENTVHVLSAGGITLAHLGDLGHPLSQETLAAIGPVDGALVPVGGTYTVDPAGAKQVCDALGPKWVLPMHYRHGPYGFPVLRTAEEFAALWPAFTRLPGAELELTPDIKGLILPTFQ